MGAEDFFNEGRGKTARDAFRAVVDRAAYLHGHDGFSGTIAEKTEFVMIHDTPATVREKAKAKAAQLRRDAKRPDNEWDADFMRQQAAHLETMAELLDDASSAYDVARLLMAMEDQRIIDKWGPAGCIEVKTPPKTPPKKPPKKQGGKVDLDALLAEIEGTAERTFLFFGLASS